MMHDPGRHKLGCFSGVLRLSVQCQRSGCLVVAQPNRAARLETTVAVHPTNNWGMHARLPTVPSAIEHRPSYCVLMQRGLAAPPFVFAGRFQNGCG